jgi:two-component system response regulator AtoC
MDRRQTVLVVDDDPGTREALCELLLAGGYQVRAEVGGAEGLAALEEMGPGIRAVLLDLVMPELDGFEFLRRTQDRQGRPPVVVLSALSDAEDVVRAMKLGASDYLPKPFDRGELDLVLRRTLEGGTEGVEPPRGPARPIPEVPEEGNGIRSVSVSAAMDQVWAMVQRVADTDVPVLIRGESGVGKDIVARRIHATSRRAAKPFVKLNCAALPGELLESELFGHEKGAFTGAHAEKPGRFELADQGTIFLDEIGEMDPRLQAKLLQVLQDEEFFRVGGKRAIRVDARVLVATHRNLEQAIAQGSFREDLYYRLNVVTVRVPALRERKEDIAPLVRFFVDKYRRRYQGGLDQIPDEVMERFHAHHWRGNVRELENLVRRLVVLKDPAMVLGELGGGRPGTGVAAELPARPSLTPISGALASHPLPAALPDDAPLKEVGRRAARLAEREAILRALMRTGWNKRKAAQRLQISYKALLYKIKECEIVDPREAAMGMVDG